MKIIDSAVDLTKPGFYWDGTSLHLVSPDKMSYYLGGFRDAFDFLNEPPDLEPGKWLTEVDSSGATYSEKLLLIEAMARLIK